MTRPLHHTVVFAGLLGGVGQTTLVANLAHLLASEGVPCLALEWNAQNSLALHLGAEQAPTKGWYGRFVAGSWIGDAVLANDAGVRCLPFGPLPPAAGQALQRLHEQPDWLAEQLQRLDLPADAWVLIDAAAASPWTVQALRCADQLVVGLEASARALQLAGPVDRLTHAIPPQAQLGLVLNRFDPRRPSHGRCLTLLERQWSSRLAPHLVHEDETCANALEQAACVCVAAEQAQSAHDFNGVLRWLQARARHPAAGAVTP